MLFVQWKQFNDFCVSCHVTLVSTYDMSRPVMLSDWADVHCMRQETSGFLLEKFIPQECDTSRFPWTFDIPADWGVPVPPSLFLFQPQQAVSLNSELKVKQTSKTL